MLVVREHIIFPKGVLESENTLVTFRDYGDISYLVVMDYLDETCNFLTTSEIFIETSIGLDYDDPTFLPGSGIIIKKNTEIFIEANTDSLFPIGSNNS